MKISQIYSNKDDVFPRLKLSDGLNVVYAKVNRPDDSGKDSHNLGKTTLLHLIDFLLLKGWAKGHFLYDHKKLFAEYVFFLEVKLNQGGYVTIRRSVAKNSRISIERHDSRRDMVGILPQAWEHSDLPFKKAKGKLDQILGLSALGGWSYRKGVGYFLRTQDDYRDVFQLQRFSRGRDSEWKPYLASVLGFEARLLREKYDLDHEIEDDEKYLDRVRQRAEDSYDKIKGLLEIKQTEFTSLRKQIDQFSFHSSDMQHNAELVEEIEQEISAANSRVYVIDYEAAKIDASLAEKTVFDMGKVERLFSEVRVHFPAGLKKSYDDLTGFNRRLAKERSERLTRLRGDLSEEREALMVRLRDLDLRRKDLMSIVQETDTLSKFRLLQKGLAHREAEIVRLEADLERVDEASRVERRIQEKKRLRSEKSLEIEGEIRRGNSHYSTIRTGFNRVMHSVLRRIAVISVALNNKGNIDFEINLQKAGSGDLTSEDKGNSYKKILCAAFDIALLVAYKDDDFFRFVYHDGILEGLDQRKKVAFLDIVRDVCANHGIQYILTLIDADIPRDADDLRVPFTEGEILRELYEGSAEGRLFRMKQFLRS